MIRTSQTDPLQIAEIATRPGWGLIGITLCPGKHDRHGLTGKWQRDLGLDLDVVADWGAAVVVTLVEPDELQWLNVASMGEEVRRRHMEWIHLPIVDGMAPSIEFDAQWVSTGESLRTRIQNGFNVLLHCKGSRVAVAVVECIRSAVLSGALSEVSASRLQNDLLIPPARPDVGLERRNDRVRSRWQCGWKGAPHWQTPGAPTRLWRSQFCGSAISCAIANDLNKRFPNETWTSFDVGLALFMRGY